MGLESGVHPPLSVSWLCEGRSVHAVGPQALFVYMPRDYLVGLYTILVLELSLAGIISPANYVSFPAIVAASLIPAGAQFWFQ